MKYIYIYIYIWFHFEGSQRQETGTMPSYENRRKCLQDQSHLLHRVQSDGNLLGGGAGAACELSI